MECIHKELVSRLPEKLRPRFKAALQCLQGRPTKFTEDLIPKILFFYAKGYTITQVAAELGIARSTYYHWLKIHDCFSDVHKIGRTMSRAYLEELALENMDNRGFNFLLLEARLRREFQLDE